MRLLPRRGSWTAPDRLPRWLAPISWAIGTGQTADDLFEKIQTSMPADQPGKLARAQNADILAFLLRLQRFSSGWKNRAPRQAPSRSPRFASPKNKSESLGARIQKFDLEGVILKSGPFAGSTGKDDDR